MPTWTREALEEIQNELFADDIDLDDKAVTTLQHLPRRTVEAYFLNGGALPPP